MESNFDIVGGFREQTYQQFDAQRTINLYGVSDREGKKPSALYPTPGHEAVATDLTGTAEGRRNGLFAHNDTLYAASSERVFRIDSALVATEITSGGNTLNTSSGNIRSVANVHVAGGTGNQIIWVDGAAGYLYSEISGVFQTISVPNFPPNPSSVVNLDGFFIANVGGTNQFRLSELNDGLNWSGGAGATPIQGALTTEADIIVGFGLIHRQLFILGEHTTEIWYNAGLSPLPLRRNNTFSVDYGCAAEGSIAEGHDRLLWLSRTKDGVSGVMMSAGGLPKSVSDEALEAVFQDFTVFSDAIGLIYKQDNYVFYQLTFPSAPSREFPDAVPARGRTFLYNVTLGVWQETSDLTRGRHAANAHAFFSQKHLINEQKSAKLFHFSDQFLTADGDNVPRIRIMHHFSDKNYKRIRLYKFQLDVVKGRAKANTVDSNPKVFLGISRDGGITYPYYVDRAMPKLGDFRKRISWYRLGTSRDFVFKVEFFNKTPFVVLGANIGFERLKV